MRERRVTQSGAGSCSNIPQVLNAKRVKIYKNCIIARLHTQAMFSPAVSSLLAHHQRGTRTLAALPSSRGSSRLVSPTAHGVALKVVGTVAQAVVGGHLIQRAQRDGREGSVRDLDGRARKKKNVHRPLNGGRAGGHSSKCLVV